MKILSIDVTLKTFRELTITNILRDHESNLIAMEYENEDGDKCILPIMLEEIKYSHLLRGGIVELHEGEVAIVKVDKE